MENVVHKLLSLQQVDSRVAVVQRKLDAVPRETRRRRAKVDEAREIVDRLTKEKRVVELEIADLELKRASIDAAIKKQQEHRDRAQNQSTFTAAQHQIEYLSEDRSKHETRELELLETVEALSPQIAAERARLAQLEADFAEYEKNAAAVEAELGAERDRVVAERAAFLPTVPDKQLALYEDLLETRGGQAVVAVDIDYCSGCNTRITPNDQAKLIAKSSLVTCKSCGRILYLPG